MSYQTGGSTFLWKDWAVTGVLGDLAEKTGEATTTSHWRSSSPNPFHPDVPPQAVGAHPQLDKRALVDYIDMNPTTMVGPRAEGPAEPPGQTLRGTPDPPQIDDPPHVGAEPHGRARVGLVLADEDGVGHRQQPHQGAVLQEPQDL